MKKLLLGVVTTLLMVTLVACGDDKVVKEKKMNSMLQEETMADEENSGLDEEISTGETDTEVGSKEISHTNTKLAVDTTGDKVTVVESFYAGISDVSKYDIKVELTAYREINITFEGPKGMARNVALENANVIMSSGNNELRIACNDFIMYGDVITGESSDYGEALEVMQTDETFWENMRNTPEEDWVQLFMMQEASSYAEVYDDYVLVMDEAPFSPEAKLSGYAGVKWFFKEPFYVMCFYAEQVNKYDDAIAMNIYNSMQWDFVE